MLYHLSVDPEQVGVIRNYAVEREVIFLCRMSHEAQNSLLSEMRRNTLELEAGKQPSIAVRLVTDGLNSLTAHYQYCHEHLKNRFLLGGGWMPDSTSHFEGTHSNWDAVLGRLRQMLQEGNPKQLDVIRELLEELFSPDAVEILDIHRLRGLFLRTLSLVRPDTSESAQISLEHFDSLTDVVDYLMELVQALFLSGSMGGSFRQYYSLICDYLAEHFREPLTLTGLAELFLFHPNYFSSAFRELAGVSFQDYISGLRLKEAQSLLSNSDASVKQIAEMVGYNSQSYFQKVFKRALGITPFEYRLGTKGITSNTENDTTPY